MSRIETGVDLPPSGGRVWYYPGPTEGAVGDYGLTARITKSDASKWYACFRSGVSDADGEVEFEADGSFVALTGGAGYHVDCEDEQNWRELPLSPLIRISHWVPQIQVLLLFDWIQAAAYGPKGELWHTPRLFLDDLELVDADEHVVNLRGGIVGGQENITLDTKGGSILSGRSFDWSDHALG